MSCSGCDCGSNCTCQGTCKCGKFTIDETSLDRTVQDLGVKTVAGNPCPCKCGDDCKCGDNCSCESSAQTSSQSGCSCGNDCSCNPCKC